MTASRSACVSSAVQGASADFSGAALSSVLRTTRRCGELSLADDGRTRLRAAGGWGTGALAVMATSATVNVWKAMSNLKGCVVVVLDTDWLLLGCGVVLLS